MSSNPPSAFGVMGDTRPLPDVAVFKSRSENNFSGSPNTQVVGRLGPPLATAIGSIELTETDCPQLVDAPPARWSASVRRTSDRTRPPGQSSETPLGSRDRSPPTRCRGRSRGAAPSRCLGAQFALFPANYEGFPGPGLRLPAPDRGGSRPVTSRRRRLRRPSWAAAKHRHSRSVLSGRVSAGCQRSAPSRRHRR